MALKKSTISPVFYTGEISLIFFQDRLVGDRISEAGPSSTQT
jgi:hypothetical protein